MGKIIEKSIKLFNGSSIQLKSADGRGVSVKASSCDGDESDSTKLHAIVEFEEKLAKMDSGCIAMTDGDGDEIGRFTLGDSDMGQFQLRELAIEMTPWDVKEFLDMMRGFIKKYTNRKYEMLSREYYIKDNKVTKKEFNSFRRIVRKLTIGKSGTATFHDDYYMDKGHRWIISIRPDGPDRYMVTLRGFGVPMPTSHSVTEEGLWKIFRVETEYS